MLHAEICLVFIMVVTIIVGLFAASRLMNAAALCQRDVAAVKLEVGEANAAAARALNTAEALKLEHYETLRQKILDVETLALSAKAAAASLDESLSTVNNKLASRVREEKKAIKGKPPEPEQLEIDSPLPEFFPMDPVAPTLPYPGQVNGHFGKKMRL